MDKGTHLKIIREKRELSKEEVSAALNITHGELDMIEQGTREINAQEAETLANLYKVHPKYLEQGNVYSDTEGFVKESFPDLDNQEQKDLLKMFGTLRKED